MAPCPRDRSCSRAGLFAYPKLLSILVSDSAKETYCILAIVTPDRDTQYTLTMGQRKWPIQSGSASLLQGECLAALIDRQQITLVHASILASYYHFLIRIAK